MKKPEKLFLLINEINDRFVDEAKDKAEKPVSVRLESRMPIKEIIAFAACFAVLAVGIFALVKFKLNSQIDPQPVDNDSSNQSFELNSNIELEYTEQDKELQTILKELVANAEEIDGMFNYLSISGEKYKFKFDEYNEREYYLVSGDTRTANGLFTVPQSYDEMEQLVSQYFSPQAAVFYMENVISSGGAAESSSDGTFHIDLPGHRIPMFIEINGRMYADPGSRGYRGMGIDCETARVIRKTDKSLEFSYWGYDFTALSYEGGDKYSERNGALVYEDGAWKLHYFYDYGFIPEFPAEYTEQDLELQNILKGLEPGDDVRELFSVNSLGGSGEIYKFRLSDNDPPDSTTTYIDVSGLQPKINHPKSINELRQRMLEYFTAEAADKYMWNVCSGTMTANPDGTYTVTLGKDLNYPTYIEIDGKMFYWEESVGSGSGTPYYNTAKVIEQTDDTIIFSYTYSGMADFYRTDERLVYERGGWKRDPFYQPESDNPPEESNGLSADDKELQGILTELVAKAREIDGMFTEAGSGEGTGYKLNTSFDSGVVWYPIPEGERTQPNGLFVMPQSRAEMETLLLTCFTQRAVKEYMNDCGTGSLVMDSDGRYSISENQDMGYKLIEVDGRLYRSTFDSYAKWYCDPETAHVISKTDKTVRFSYYSKSSDWDENEGAIVYENGGWKLNYFHDHGFIPELPIEFTDEDLELQEIMSGLSTGFSINSWFYNGYYNSDEHYEFVFPENDFGNVFSYSPLPEGRSKYGDLEYPGSRDEFEKLLLKYFTREAVDKFMSNLYSGTMTKNADGRYSVITDKQITRFPPMLEIDGRIYFGSPERGGGGVEFLNAVKVIDKTADSIRFSYIDGAYGMYFSNRDNGLIKYERGGWRLNYFYHDFINDNEN